MPSRQTSVFILAAATGLSVGGCESLPGSNEQQGAVGGAVVGAGAGAVIGGEGNRLLGALIGGAVGAGGGYLIGANWEKLTGNERDDAIEAQRQADANPAKPEDVRAAETADINNDGYVTMDEVVAMEAAGLSDREIVDRLRATNHYFELNSEQEQYLRDRGVSNTVIAALGDMNEESERLARENRVNQTIGSAEDD